MMARRWALPAAATAATLVLAGCYGGWLFGIVESFGTPNGAKISTIAGNGTAGYSGNGGQAVAAELNQPSGVAFDSSGNLYIADTNNSVIRMISPNGTITTVAGNHIAGYYGDGGPATSAKLNNPLSVAVDSSGNLYIADASNNRIRKVDTSGTISTVAGSGTPPSNYGYSPNGTTATSALLNYPTGVAVDGIGNFYIADFDNSVIREVSGGMISTIAGNGTPGYLGDGGLATNAELNYPYGVTVDSSGNLYIADTTNAVIRKVSGGTISTIAGNSIVGYSGDGGPATSASIDLPTSLAVDQAGNLYIADRNNGVIRKVDSSGTISTVAGNWHLGNGYAGDGNVATAAMLNLPWGVAVDSLGNLFIADAHNNRIRKVSLGR